MRERNGAAAYWSGFRRSPFFLLLARPFALTFAFLAAFAALRAACSALVLR